MKTKTCALIAVAVALASSSASAQTRPTRRGPDEEGGKVTVAAGYMQGAGNVTAAITYFDDRYDTFWVGDQKMPLPAGLGKIKTRGITANLTVGAIDNLDFYANVPYTHAEATAAGAPSPQAALGDIEGGLRYRFTTFGAMESSRTDIIGTGAVRFPAVKYDGDRPVAIGHHATTIAPGVLVFSRWSEHVFTMVSGAYDFVSGGPPNDFRYSLQAGLDGSGFAGSVRYEQQISAHGTDIGQGPFTTNEQPSKRLGVNFYGEIREGLGVTADVRWVLNGKNIGKAKGYSVGMVIRAPR